MWGWIIGSPASCVYLSGSLMKAIPRLQKHPPETAAKKDQVTCQVSDARMGFLPWNGTRVYWKLKVWRVCSRTRIKCEYIWRWLYFRMTSWELPIWGKQIIARAQIPSGVDLTSSIFECLSRKTAEGSNVMVVWKTGKKTPKTKFSEKIDCPLATFTLGRSFSLPRI